jgi:hypothetical protein
MENLEPGLQTTWMPKIAGLLSIIAGAVGILGGSIIVFMIYLMTGSFYYVGPEHRYLWDLPLWVFIIPFFIINVIAIAGGVMALKRRIWGMALAGAICSMLTPWTLVLGAASIVFLIRSRNEFNITGLSSSDSAGN